MDTVNASHYITQSPAQKVICRLLTAIHLVVVRSAVLKFICAWGTNSVQIPSELDYVGIVFPYAHYSHRKGTRRVQVSQKTVLCAYLSSAPFLFAGTHY